MMACCMHLAIGKCFLFLCSRRNSFFHCGFSSSVGNTNRKMQMLKTKEGYLGTIESRSTII